MNNTLFIASRLKYRRKIVTVSIAISYIVMIVAMAVSSGFRHEVRNALSEMGLEQTVRGEALTMEQLAELSDRLW